MRFQVFMKVYDHTRSSVKILIQKKEIAKLIGVSISKMKTFGEERMSTEKLITEKVLTLKGNVKIKYVLTQEVKKNMDYY